MRRRTPLNAQPAVSWKWTNGDVRSAALVPAIRAIKDKRIYPYSVLPLPAFDLAVSTTTDMDEGNKAATSEWIQLWQLSQLKLRRSIALQPGPRGDENQFTGEARLLPDGKSVYIHTFNCGLYLLRDVDRPEPKASFVKAFTGKNCGVPILTGHYWIQTVPDAHAVVALDITNPEQPREVSVLDVGEDEQPHWISIDSTGRRIGAELERRRHGQPPVRRQLRSCQWTALVRRAISRRG